MTTFYTYPELTPSWPGDRTSTKRPNTFAQTCLSSHTFTLQFDGGPYISDGTPVLDSVSSELTLKALEFR